MLMPKRPIVLQIGLNDWKHKLSLLGVRSWREICNCKNRQNGEMTTPSGELSQETESQFVA